ncbi:MAG: putative transport system permease protein [Patescibacteria group bacterium]|nr:putative transport system permease protein [Patescibacteria group bacterium]
MRYKDIVLSTRDALSANKMRTVLTILGIVIGIGSVISMTSIGQGAKKSIEQSIQSVGSNLLIIQGGQVRTGSTQISAGRGGAKILTIKDLQVVQALDTLQAVSGEVSGRYQIVTKGKNTNTQVIGASPEYEIVRSVSVDIGSFFTDSDNERKAKVAIIGPTTRNDLFGEDADPVGQTIRIKNISFRIIGVTVPKGGSGFTSQDDMIIVPLLTAQHYLTGDEYVGTISASAWDTEQIEEAKTSIQQALFVSRNIEDASMADFSIISQADIVATASSITNTFTILLAAIASISLLVGGIGIMNMMLTSVSERTREIGLRKAIGASNKDIYLQFLFEAITLTIIGGIVGIVLGVSASFSLQFLGIIQTAISLTSILLAFGVSASIGIIFGFYPARKAAKLSPIKALRFE